MLRWYVSVLGIGAVSVAGCTTGGPGLAGKPAAAIPAMPPALAERVERHFAPMAETGDLSGTLRIERDGAPVLTRSFGFADWEKQAPHGARTRYSAASVTKSITAATLVCIARAGTLSLDDPAGRWLPQLVGNSGITLRAILGHRAGLPRDLPDSFPSSGQSVAFWVAANPDRLSEAGKEHYSNIGYALLAEVIESATGKTFADAAQSLVLEPAGMADSLIRLQTADSFPGGALPYTAGPEPDGIMTPVAASLQLGSSGLITTAADLARWARALGDGAFPELFEGPEPLGSIDAGSDENGAYISVQGTLPGYVASATAWRNRDLTVSFTGNLFSFPSLGLDDDLRDLVKRDPLAAPEPRPAAVPLTDRHLRLVGDHDHPNFGTLRIARSAHTGHLQLTVPGRPAFWTFHLTPIADGAVHWRAFDYILSSNGEGGLEARRRQAARTGSD